MPKLLIEWGILFGLVLTATILVLGIRNRLWKPSTNSPRVHLFGYYSHLLTQLKYGRHVKTEFQPSEWTRLKKQLAVAAELGAILLWALWLGRHLLVMNTMEWLAGD